MTDPILDLLLSMVTPGPCGVLHSVNTIQECTPGWIYIAKCDALYKIGRTANKTHKYRGVGYRLKSLNQLTQKNFVFHLALHTSCVVGFEHYMHDQFKHCAQGNELFRLSADDLIFIESISEFANQPVQHILTAP